MIQKKHIRTIVRGIAFIGLFGLLAAPTCNQPFGPTATGSGSPSKILNAFGDSIAAGYVDSFPPGQTKSYVGFYADQAAADRGHQIVYQGFTTSGETTPQIEARMRNNLSQLREAEFFTWDAGGNDFLDARGDYYGNCNVGALDNALDAWRGDWDDLLDTVESNVGLTAASAPFIRTMNVYYPNPDQDRASGCSGQGTRFEVLLPRLLAAGDYMCSTAEARGWRCADTIAAMNCREDGAGNPDFDCANKRYLQNLVDSGICPRNVTSSAYASPSIDPNCIRAHLDSTGDWDAFFDPARVVKNGQTLDLMQGDDTHPNSAGHRRLAGAHHDLGYDDVEGPLVENTYAQCIDFEDNDGDGKSDCSDAGCAAFCGQ
ncbi:GDSL-type esterase/lipase family protein [Haliangium sp.]|uniref:GDSL-type esterase/lipase family protein n=1 Tax=Haliangium sp. TaxID=2663208 RepID=UPI003D0F84CC